MTYLVILAVGACPAEAAAPRRTLAVAAAANLQGAAAALEAAFEASQPEVDVVFTLGASGTFFSQLTNGAPFDVFLSADREYPARVVAAGLADPADERVYALGRLVTWVPADSKLDLETRGLQALIDPAVKRIALANPAVAPYGRAAMKALEAAGVAAAVKDKLVLGTSVAQAAQFVTTGAADVAFLPASLAQAAELARGRAVPVPEALAGRLEQSGVVLKGAREPSAARAFLAFLGSPRGRAILLERGHGLP